MVCLGGRGDADFAAIHELVGLQAPRVRDRTAIACREVRFTYGDVELRANRLAHVLRDRGIGRETLVGIYAERSPEAVIGLLAVLKAGGAYLPLDASYPAARVARINAEAGVSLMLAGPAQVQMFPDALPLDLRLDGMPGDAPEPCNKPQDLALVLYTSGSTGAPKGVEITHANLVANLCSWEATHRLSTLRALAQTAHFSFAVFQSDVFRALASGLSLIVCPPEVLRSPAALLALLRRERVDFLEAVPSLVRTLLAYAEPRGERLDTLRELVVSADRWYTREQRAAALLLPADGRVSHVYGLTETTFDATWQAGSMPASRPNELAPIGRPFPHVEANVLDAAMRPVGPGIEGYLCIGGEGVARGYRHRPDLTTGRFIEPPGLATGRLYWTGDLAKLLPDGTISLLGRADLQVKIRGFRVELGEVEGALESHPDISQCVVQAFADLSEGRLVAFFMSRRPLSSVELRGFLAEQLPDFMIPAEFVRLPALPLTPSGKIDRNRLRAPEPEPAPAEVPAGTDPDGIVRLIVQATLGTADLTDTEPLAARGLDSLGMSSILVGLETAFGFTVDPVEISAALFESIETLRSYVRGRRSESG